MNSIDSQLYDPTKKSYISRRDAFKAMAVVTACVVAPKSNGAIQPQKKLRLGLDAHSVRAMKWSAIPIIEYAGKQRLDAVLLNDLQYFESLDNAYLKTVKALADSKGLSIFIGGGGISKGSKSFNGMFGTTEQTLAKAIQVASLLGSPTVNVKIGNFEDRSSSGGIDARMDEAIATLKAVTSQALDAGVKFAFENHAGDTRSEEVLTVISAVGPDLCGAMLDPGNSVWAMEDPMSQLKKLGPHVLCTSIRDYMVWESADGAICHWTAIGDGLMDVPVYIKLFQEFCPEVPLFVESISNKQYSIPFLSPTFRKAYPALKAADIAEFLVLCRKGHALAITTPAEGVDPKEFEREHQKSEFERSIAALHRALS